MSTLTEAEVRTIVREELSRLMGDEVGPGEIPDDLLLFDLGAAESEGLGLDSLDALELVMTLEDAFGVSPPRDIDFKELSTVGSIVSLVLRLSEKARS